MILTDHWRPAQEFFNESGYRQCAVAFFPPLVMVHSASRQVLGELSFLSQFDPFRWSYFGLFANEATLCYYGGRRFLIKWRQDPRW